MKNFLNTRLDGKKSCRNIIYSQIEKLGCSVDWNRVNFTMDDHYYKTVMKYSWSYLKRADLSRCKNDQFGIHHKNSLRRRRVEYKDIQGKLYYVKYKLPEPMIADDCYTTSRDHHWATQQFV